MHDFDFIHGEWAIANRRLTDMLDPTCETWEEFDARGAAEPILGGMGNTDRMWMDDSEGFTLRLYDPAADLWRIWWSSTVRPGRLDPPVEGRFTDGVGTFATQDVIDGVAIGVRFVWDRIAADSASWRQDFSFDDGATWRTTWTMDFTRA